LVSKKNLLTSILVCTLSTGTDYLYILYAVLRIRIRDPVLFYPKDPDPGSGMIIPLKNIEKDENLNFV
jgi:hypothetical protein